MAHPRVSGAFQSLHFSSTRRQPQQQQQQQPVPTSKTVRLLQEWGPTVLAGLLDLVVAAGVVPIDYVSIARLVVLCILLRRGLLAFLISLVLPNAVPIMAVCFLQWQLQNFMRFVQGKITEMVAKASKMAAASPAGGDGLGAPASQSGVPSAGAAGARVRPLEVSGYDVSSVSGEEVVELSSWPDNSAASSREATEVRRRTV